MLQTNIYQRQQNKKNLKFRLAEHRGYVTNEDLSKATGEHCNAHGHKKEKRERQILYKKV